MLGASVLFLDEVAANLDEKNVAEFVSMLGRLPGMGFTQVFVISHRQEVADALPYVIKVRRIEEDGCSVLAET
jgi:DNA repair exonuclease SbcCD ATPase subunit